MVQDYSSPVRVHKYPFEMVMAAYERRFPNCPQIPVVLECVITDDSWSADNSQRHTTRRCQLNVDAPYLLKKMVGVDYIYFLQKNHLDLRNRVLKIEATNESFASKVGVVEKCKYYVHPDNPEWTCFEQTAELDVKNFFGLEATVEKIAMKQYAANIAKGKELIESFMREVHTDGVTSLDRWEADKPRQNAELRRILSRATEPLSPVSTTESLTHSQPGPSVLRRLSRTLRHTSSQTGHSGSQHKLTHKRSQSMDSEKSRASVSSSKTHIYAGPSSLALKTSRVIQNTFKNITARGQTALRQTKSKLHRSHSAEDVQGSSSHRRSHGSLTNSSQSCVSGCKNNPVKGLNKKVSYKNLTACCSSSTHQCEDQGQTGTGCSSAPEGGLTAAALLVAVLIVLYDQFTMDSEYIKRYLGELTPVQESRLLQLRKWISELQKGKVPSDTTLLRFLRARDFHVEKAREMLSQSLLWRKKHQVDRILSEYETPEVVKQYFPGGWHHHDKDGRPLYVLRLGQMDVKGLLKSIGEDGLLKLTLHVCEEGLKLLEEATRTAEHAVYSWCLLVDLDGLNMRHLWRPGVRALLRIIQIVEANYPETMGRVLIVRAPRVFPILWTIVSTFIDDNTRSKFLFYGGKDYLQPGGLLDYIPKDLIPDFLGGPCKSFVHEGGLVPKSLYVSGAFLERDGDPLSEDSIYQSVSLGKGQVHEVIVINRDPQSVLTWDFDVMRQDIGFTVFRTDLELSTAADDAVDNTANCVGGGDVEVGRSVLDNRAWKEGDHYHRAEPTLICHDGESIQGSHVMVSAGSYVLQWRCEALDSLPHRSAAQLMYCHETLASHHYKGSMSSLQSGASGFSCLSNKSAGSSCPSR